MPSEESRLVLGGYEAWNRRDLEAALEIIDPEVVWTFSGGAQFPGTELTYHGHAGVREFWSTFLEPWPDLRVEVEGVQEGGDGRFLVDVRFQAVAEGSGIEFDQRFSHVLTLREVRLVRFEAFADRDAALEAAGLPSPGTSPPG